MKFTREQYIAVITIVLVCTSVVGYWYGYAKVVAMRGSVRVEREELARLVSQEQQHRSLETFLQTNENDRKELAGHLLSIDNPSPFLALIESIASDAGVLVEVETLEVHEGVTNEDAKNDVPADTGTYLRVVLNVSGSWPEIYHFINLVEYLPYATLVDRVVVSVDDAVNDGSWTGQLHLRALVQ